jgi:hypothetical protein
MPISLNGENEFQPLFLVSILSLGGVPVEPEDCIALSSLFFGLPKPESWAVDKNSTPEIRCGRSSYWGDRGSWWLRSFHSRKDQYAIDK